MPESNLDNLSEISNLAKLASDKSLDKREFLYERIGNFLVNEGQSFSVSEKKLMAEIICQITGDVEKSIRSHFAKRLSLKSDVPAELMIFLANDDIEVALPILRDSGLLSEPDLLKIVKHRSTQHQLAVAARDNISPNVCQAIYEIGKSDVTVKLLENQTAQITPELLAHIADQSEFILEYQTPLIKRPFLPQPIAEKMYRWVSVALREYISDNFDVDAKVLQIDVADRLQTINSISMESDPSAKLVSKLHAAGDLTAGFMVKALRQGEIDLFELSFAKLLDIDVEEFGKILYADNPEILAAACRSLNLDRIIFKTIFELTLSVRREKDSILTPAVLNAPMDFYDLLSEEAANTALHNAEFMQGALKYADTI
ncbi:DUF2336 domain-containing protein [Sneathiella marina]|uniref:DUF2336 domain-containing protein n=1 Tax=Sneathiella marina TaxID=2950108 RepID=A0ABY4VY42_9PROT|nr:DUF2336 domain-containing protein [Sneathiella marina]USG59847.1 DUF2336 domain-containing protein [Sneathiella marina]